MRCGGTRKMISEGICWAAMSNMNIESASRLAIHDADHRRSMVERTDEAIRTSSHGREIPFQQHASGFFP